MSIAYSHTRQGFQVALNDIKDMAAERANPLRRLSAHPVAKIASQLDALLKIMTPSERAAALNQIKTGVDYSPLRKLLGEDFASRYASDSQAASPSGGLSELIAQGKGLCPAQSGADIQSAIDFECQDPAPR